MTSAPVSCPSPFNLAAYVLTAGLSTPEKAALCVLSPDGAEVMRYADLRQRILGTATGLLQNGLRVGDRVLMRLGNTPDFPVTYLGAIAAGLVPIPTSSQLTATEATAIARETSPALVVASPDVALPDHPAPVLSLDVLRGFANLPPADFAMGDPDRPAYIIYTSGTGGQPRAVVHAHRAIWARRMMWDGWYGLTASDRLLHAGAFNWTYTLGTGLMDPWAIGATALIPAAGTKPTEIPALMLTHGATIFAAAPGVYRQMLRARIPALPALRHGLSAGEKLPATIAAAWHSATGTVIHEAYGMSECSTFVSGSPARPAPEGSLGFAQDGRRISLRQNGAESDPGVIAVHRSDPGLMLGYMGQPEETAARFDGDWFLTGDIGHRTADGAIASQGRADDMMNAGGYRVSPIEVEAALATHPEVQEAAATEVTVKDGVSVIAAFYTAAAPVPDEALAAHAAAVLSRYKCPRLYVHVDALPRGANNKLLRRVLRQNWEADHGQA